MNLNPLRLIPKAWLPAAGRKAPEGDVRRSSSPPEGPYSSVFTDWVAREVSPYLYEAIREAVGPIDGAINRLVTLDGIIRVQGGNDKLVSEIEDWMGSIQVNDMESGLQAFYRSQGNEMYEQGFTIGEPVLNESGRDVVQLKVADSKGVYFKRAAAGTLEVWYAPPSPDRGRKDGTQQIERVLRNSYRTSGTISAQLSSSGYTMLDRSMLVYAGFNNEADNPYGVSLMRSTEFDARVLLVMKNSLYQVWSRFGDPSFAVTYKTKARISGEELEVRRGKLATNLANVLDIKKQGNSADFVNAVGKDDEIEIVTIGADGQVLEIEMPARHILENIVSKTGIPSWMLGFHWSTAERLAQRQAEIALQESRTRFNLRQPGNTRLVETMLRARGRTWKKGDWEFYQDLPNIQDLVAQAQARFLDAQTEMMLSGTTRDDIQPAKVTRSGKLILPTDDDYAVVKHAHDHGHKAEEYVEDEENLMRLERAAEREMLGAWDKLYDSTLAALGIEAHRAAKAGDVLFIFDPATMAMLLRDHEVEFVAAVGGADAELVSSMYRAWVRGVANAAEELGIDELAETARASVSRAMADRGLELVTNTTLRTYRNDIVLALEQGAYDGLSPKKVAAALRQRFQVHETDWLRLARSEMAAAQGRGKLDQYAAHGLEQYDWKRAGGACPICVGLAEGSPYTIGAGPMPMTNSHPNCRCTVLALVPEADE